MAGERVPTVQALPDLLLILRGTHQLWFMLNRGHGKQFHGGGVDCSIPAGLANKEQFSVGRKGGKDGATNGARSKKTGRG